MAEISTTIPTVDELAQELLLIQQSGPRRVAVDWHKKPSFDASTAGGDAQLCPRSVRQPGGHQWRC